MPGAVANSYELQSPFRLVLDVQKQGEALSLAPPASEEQPAARSSLQVIVVDPGHGGAESGAVGPTGAQEKLTLLIARGLKRQLEAELPVKVVLTRTDDADLPLDSRAAIADQNRADLFVSVHLNSSLGSSARGAETYFLSMEASDARAAAAAEAENLSPSAAATGAPVLDDLQLILWEAAQTHHLTGSQRFANLVQEELNQALGLRDRGVKQAPFRVLMGVAAPAVLHGHELHQQLRRGGAIAQSEYRAERERPGASGAPLPCRLQGEGRAAAPTPHP